jgi:hypothetical protein
MKRKLEAHFNFSPPTDGDQQTCIWKKTEQSLNCYFNSYCKTVVGAGLPDSIFSKQKIPIWVNFGGSCNG